MSRELDAQVAEKVMGWFKSREDGGVKHMWRGRDLGLLEADGEWSPSTRIEDAWMVVEKMREIGWFLTLRVGEEACHADFYRHPAEGVDGVSESAESAPEAICLAAISACAP